MWEQTECKGPTLQDDSVKESYTCVPKDVLSVQIYVKSVDKQG